MRKSPEFPIPPVLIPPPIVRATFFAITEFTISTEPDELKIPPPLPD